MGGTVALFFDGATCTFNELPLPNEVSKLAKVYEYIKQINNRKSKVTMFIHSLFKKNK